MYQSPRCQCIRRPEGREPTQIEPWEAGDEKRPTFDWHCQTQARQREPKSIRGLPANRSGHIKFLVMLKFVTYVMKDQKNEGEPQPDKKAGAFNFDSLCIYHALIDKLRILDYGNGAKFMPPVPTAPKSRLSPQTPTKRQGDAAADAAFDRFGCKTSQSPTKRTRSTKTA
ncbi:hypothetical protein C8R45DRAFT_946493 [Mycena sanguinolenta]|nr:hypothetical protein C8R45DRAFT_946493 [Mycena sanguinolenta]